MKSSLKATGKKTTQAAVTPTTVLNTQQQNTQQEQEPVSPQPIPMHTQQTQTDHQTSINDAGQNEPAPQPDLPPGMYTCNKCCFVF